MPFQLGCIPFCSLVLLSGIKTAAGAISNDAPTYITQTSGTCGVALTEDECAQIARLIDAPGGSTHSTICGSSSCAPLGCYQFFSRNGNNMKVYYNSHKTGACSTARKCFCKATTVTQTITAETQTVTQTTTTETQTAISITTTAMAQRHHGIHHQRIICPFLRTLINEGVLPVKTEYSQDELLHITVQAGLSRSSASNHIAGNFKNNPSGRQDIFSMEGAANEHRTSTGIHDCPTSYTECNTDEAGHQHCANQTQLCFAPNHARFHEFWDLADTNSDGQLTHDELKHVEPILPFNDANPIGEGTINGSFGFLLDVFGDADGKMGKEQFQRVNLDSRFPTGYFFEVIAVGVYTIQNLNSGKYISVAGGQIDNGANIQPSDRPNETHSQWVLSASTHGAYTVQNVLTNKYLSVANAADCDGANIHQWDNPESLETQWKVREVAPGVYTFENLQSEQYINIHQCGNPEASEAQWILHKVTVV